MDIQDQNLQRLREETEKNDRDARKMLRLLPDLEKNEAFQYLMELLMQSLNQAEADVVYGSDASLPHGRTFRRGEACGMSRAVLLLPSSIAWAREYLRVDDEEEEQDG